MGGDAAALKCGARDQVRHARPRGVVLRREHPCARRCGQCAGWSLPERTRLGVATLDADTGHEAMGKERPVTGKDGKTPGHQGGTFTHAARSGLKERRMWGFEREHAELRVESVIPDRMD